MIVYVFTGHAQKKKSNDDDEVVVLHDDTKMRKPDLNEVSRILSRMQAGQGAVGRPGDISPPREGNRIQQGKRRRHQGVGDDNWETGSRGKRFRAGRENDRSGWPYVSPCWRAYADRLGDTSDIFVAEGIMQEIAEAFTSWHDEILYSPKMHLYTMATMKVEEQKTPPCTFFNIGICEYKDTFVHATRGNGKALRVVRRAHICGVCYGQQLIAPHRARDCPLLRELELAMANY